MSKRRLTSPFFVVNPKSYLYGDDIVNFAKECDALSELYNVDILFTGQHVDLYRLSKETKNLIITAQHMDGHDSGRGMGKILAEGLRSSGVDATFLNHAEHPMSIEELVNSMKKAEALGLLTIVCANSIREAQTIASLNPDIIVCEPTELIGTGKTSDISYMKLTNEAVREVNNNIYLLQAAGISSVSDVEQALESGADGTGGTSGIVCAKDPIKTVESMLQVISNWKKKGEIE